jgi:type II secretory pathway pseudopilin PulG
LAFTLVEVLASLVLMGVILPVAMQGISVALGLTGSARRQMEAVGLAEDRLAEVLVAEEWRDGDASGDFGEDYPDYEWVAVVEDWDGSVVRQVSVQVVWTSRGKERDVIVSTLVYDEDA